jgi:hypothetical protein
MASESIPSRGGVKITRLLALNDGVSAMCGIMLFITLGATAGLKITVQLTVQFYEVRTAQSLSDL